MPKNIRDKRDVSDLADHVLLQSHIDDMREKIEQSNGRIIRLFLTAERREIVLRISRKTPWIEDVYSALHVYGSDHMTIIYRFEDEQFSRWLDTDPTLAGEIAEAHKIAIPRTVSRLENRLYHADRSKTNISAKLALLKGLCPEKYKHGSDAIGHTSVFENQITWNLNVIKSGPTSDRV